MSYFPDLGRHSMVAAGDHVRAIGWLHPDHAYTKGAAPPDFLTRLKEFVAQSHHSADALYFGAFGGIHVCEFCQKACGVANFGVLGGDLLYVAPEMIVHYVEQHDYSPPAEFIQAVLRCPLPASEEYQVLCEPFWHLHRKQVERLVELTRGGEKAAQAQIS